SKDISQAQINQYVPPTVTQDLTRPVILDIEVARYTDIDQDPDQTGLINAMTWVRESVPNPIVAGYYTLTLPIRTYFGNDSPSELAAWQAKNDATAAKILSHVDFLNPSIYTFYSPNHPTAGWIQGWIDYATRMLTEARPIAGG